MGISLMESRRRILLNTPHIETASGGIATVSTDMTAPLKSCVVTINPVQSGSGDPSPDNVRPISGWNAVNAWRTGKNLLPASLPSNVIAGTLSTSSDKIESATNARVFAIPIPKNTTIHVQKSLSDILAGGIALGDTGDIAVGTPIYNGNGFTNLQDVTYQSTGEHGWLYISTSSQANAEAWFTTRKLAVFVGAYRQDYVAPANTGTTYPITIPDPPGTVYGGTLDVTNGVLTVDMVYEQIDPNNVKQSVNIFRYPISDMKSGNGMNGLCSRFPTVKNSSVFGIRFGADNSTCYFYKLKDNISEITDLESCQAWFTNNPTYILYPLATPVTIPLTPQQISALKGVNNIWADCGPVNIKYWTH